MRLRYRSIVFLISLVLLVSGLSSGCVSLNSQNSDTLVTKRTVTDATGKQITIPVKPQKIVSLLVSTDEMLLDLLPPERIAAVSYLADDPGVSSVVEKAKKVPDRVRTYSTEAIINLHPDLVVMSDFWQPDFIVQLNQAGIPVYRCKTPYSVAAIADTIREVADIVGEKEKGERMAATYLAKVAKIKEKAAQIPKNKVKRIYPIGSHGHLGSRGSLFDDMSKSINAVNVVADIVGENQDLAVSEEQLLNARIDCIITAVWDVPGTKKQSRTREEILNNPAYATIPAIINGDVVEVPGKCFYCVDQYAAESMEMFAKAVYPFYFK